VTPTTTDTALTVAAMTAAWDPFSISSAAPENVMASEAPLQPERPIMGGITSSASAISNLMSMTPDDSDSTIYNNTAFSQHEPEYNDDEPVWNAAR